MLDDPLSVMYAKDWQSGKDDVFHFSSVEIP